MNTNPQATTTPNLNPQAPKPVSPAPPLTVTPATPTLSIKKEEPAPISKVAPTAPQPSAPRLVTASDKYKSELREKKKARLFSPEQKEALLVNRLLNMKDYLSVSDKDLTQGLDAVEKRIKTLQQLERTLEKYQRDRAQKAQEQERSITAQKAMDLFLEGKAEEGKKLFEQYKAKYGEKK